MLAVALVTALSLPALTAADRVAIQVDGETLRVGTYAPTVDQALVAAGIEVGPRDRVVPDSNEPVEDGLGIEVVRAVPVAISYDGRTRVLAVAGRTVQDVLVAAGIGDIRGLSVEPGRDTPLSPGHRVEVTQPMVVRIHVDGLFHTVRLREGTVARALAYARVAVRPSDEVSLPLERELDGDVEISVVRHDTKEVVEEVRLYFHEHVIRTDARFVGESAVVREGAEGVRRDTYRVALVDGREAGRELIAQDVVVEPVDREVEVGTRPRPAPPPPPSSPTSADDDGVWDRLARCESGGNWASRGAYHGGLQFHPDTWNVWKPAGYPAYAYEATREQQIHVGRRLHAARGWAPWPACARQLGLA